MTKPPVKSHHIQNEEIMLHLPKTMCSIIAKQSHVIVFHMLSINLAQAKNIITQPSLITAYHVQISLRPETTAGYILTHNHTRWPIWWHPTTSFWGNPHKHRENMYRMGVGFRPSALEVWCSGTTHRATHTEATKNQQKTWKVWDEFILLNTHPTRLSVCLTLRLHLCVLLSAYSCLYV